MESIAPSRDKGPRSYIGFWVSSEDINRSEEGQIASRSSQLKSHEWGTSGVQSKEEFFLRYDKRGSSMYSGHQSDPPRSSHDRNVPYEHTRKQEIRKYLKESFYHHIKCTVTTFLATFMWRRHLNSAALATTTHRRLERMSDGTDTQVGAQMINKCKTKITQRDLYNGGDPPWKRGGGEKKRKREYCSNLNYFCIQRWSIYIRGTSSDWKSPYIRTSYLCLIVI